MPRRGAGVGAGDSAGPFAALSICTLPDGYPGPVRWSVPWLAGRCGAGKAFARAGRKKSSLTWPTDPARQTSNQNNQKENAASALSQRCRDGVFILLWGLGRCFRVVARLRQRFFL